MVRTSGSGTLLIQPDAETSLVGACYVVPGAEPRSMIGCKRVNYLYGRVLCLGICIELSP